MTYLDLATTALGGNPPFPYQTILAEADFPPVLHVPTGAGKTAAVSLAWLWRRLCHPDQAVRAATPRRLVYCLPTRVLVEQTRKDATTWIARLQLSDRVSVHTLMGGEIDRDWDRSPDREAVIIGTQDQLLSRALNRGYAMSRYRWPMQYAWLNNDCLWIMDEIQLMGPSLPTTVQLDAFRKALGVVGHVQSLWMSATVDAEALKTTDAPHWPEPMRLSDEDRERPELAQRLNARKSLSRCPVDADGKTVKGLAGWLLDRHIGGSMTLVVTNTIARAQAIAKALGLGRPADDDAPEVILLHSHYRPAERAGIVERVIEEKVLPEPGRIVVSTQAVEAGVDVSARTLVTELAPWPSLVQRFGRLNRYGEFDQADAFWIDVAGKPRPYDSAAVDAARERLVALDDVSIRALEEVGDAPRQAVHPVLRRPDVLNLYDTTPDLSGQDVDVSIYIREADDLDVRVFWRDLDAKNPHPDECRPMPDELCPVGIGDLRKFIGKIKPLQAYLWDALSGEWSSEGADRLRPGLTLLLPSSAGGYDPALGWTGTTPGPVAVLPDTDRGSAMDTYDRDQHQSLRRQTLAEHTDEVVRELHALRQRLGPVPGLDDDEWRLLLTAARWHDAGKAHPELQRIFGQDTGETLLAKSPNYDTGRSNRKRFRHELASALAALQNDVLFPAAYLAACHHGKVRLSIRSMPDEPLPEDPDVRFARGIWEGDALPEADLGGGAIMPPTTLSLACMELGESEAGRPSWLARALEMREHYGPFRLAYLEALLRAADWAASAKGDGTDD